MSGLIRARVNAAALRANLALMRARAPASRVLAVIKANAYGHGLVGVARALGAADALAVARLEEGAVLRAAGVRAPVVVLQGVIDREQLREAARLGLQLVIHQPLQLALLEQFAGPERFAVWLKVDTGMNRLGFTAAQFPQAWRRAQALRPRLSGLRVLTHLSCAEEVDGRVVAEQLARFAPLTAGLDAELSVANSAAVLAHPATHLTWIRPGLALYGLSPFPGRCGGELGLRAAMTLESTVIAVRELAAGERVGYGGAWRAARPSRLAIVAAGYGDGLLRALPSGTPVLIGGRAAPLAGRVSMDMIAVDVTELPALEVGAPVELWGPHLPVESLAAAAGSIPYELVCSVTQRVPIEFTEMAEEPSCAVSSSLRRSAAQPL